jgi:hypothetical protein
MALRRISSNDADSLFGENIIYSLICVAGAGNGGLSQILTMLIYYYIVYIFSGFATKIIANLSIFMCEMK